MPPNDLQILIMRIQHTHTHTPQKWFWDERIYKPILNFFHTEDIFQRTWEEGEIRVASFCVKLSFNALWRKCKKPWTDYVVEAMAAVIRPKDPYDRHQRWRRARSFTSQSQSLSPSLTFKWPYISAVNQKSCIWTVLLCISTDWLQRSNNSTTNFPFRREIFLI